MNQDNEQMRGYDQVMDINEGDDVYVQGEARLYRARILRRANDRAVQIRTLNGTLAVVPNQDVLPRQEEAEAN